MVMEVPEEEFAAVEKVVVGAPAVAIVAVEAVVKEQLVVAVTAEVGLRALGWPAEAT